MGPSATCRNQRQPARLLVNVANGMLIGGLTPKVLLLDPDGAVPTRVQAALRKNFDIEVAVDPGSAAASRYELALVAPQSNPVGVCRALLETSRARDVVVLGREPLLRDAIAAIRARAADFVPNCRDPEAVVTAVQHVYERQRLDSALEHAQHPRDGDPLPELLGESESIERLKDRLIKVTSSDVTVLITGESGSGKEIVAKALHARGPRRAGRFVAVSCGAVPRALLESEFFGWVRGAFTDATRDHAGLLAHASGGTLFLDEIGDMPLELQPKLLRALQERTARPLGAREEKPFDVRVIAASGRDLDRDVAAGRLREDLFFRLNVLRVRVPPLRERGNDVLLLAQHFIRRAASKARPVVGLTPAAARALLEYDWPGNVRELEHCIMAAVAVARYDHIRAPDLVESVRRNKVDTPEPESGKTLREVEREHVLRVLGSVDGNKAQAAKLLGLDRKTLYRKLREYSNGESGEAPLSGRRRAQSA